jgi:hypothetical protein
MGTPFRTILSGRLGGGLRLVAETGAYGDADTADGAATVQDGSTGLGLHSSAETVGFHAFASIWLKCALGHENALLFPGENLCLDGKF